jgi:hypothetical protein
MIVVADELNVSARLSCGLALVAYMKTAEVLGLSQDLAGCLEPSHKVGPFGGYVQATDNPRELANASGASRCSTCLETGEQIKKRKKRPKL